MKIDRTQVKRILVITLSNAGDIILTTPVLATLDREFPASRIDVMVGPRGKAIFEKDTRVFKLIIYDKHLPLSAKRRLQLKLKKMRYDLVVDLRNTVFPLFISPKYRTSAVQKFPAGVVHSMDKHLHRLHSLGIKDYMRQSRIYIPPEDEESIAKIARDEDLGDPIVVISPGAKSHLKRWKPEAFASVADSLIETCKADVIFIGLEEDAQVVADVIKKMKHVCRNFVNRTNIRQLAALLKRSRLLITNDSAPLHLGCAVGAKVLALFGPTDPRKYGPTGDCDAVVNKKLHCSPCEAAVCAYNYECMTSIDPDEVFNTAKEMIEGYE